MIKKWGHFALYPFAFVVIILLGFPLLSLDGHKDGVIQLNKPIELPFLVDKNIEEVLVYFGYVGCEHICTPALQEIAAIYSALPMKETVQVYFINISKEGGGAHAFATYFHPDFIGLEYDKGYKLKDTLHVYSSASLSGDGTMSHTGFLYRIQRTDETYSLRAMYVTRPFSKEAIIQNIEGTTP